MIWMPHVTVAAVIEQDGKFLLVEEHTSQGLMFNQPAGHLEPDESLIAGVSREVLEEAARDFEPQYLIIAGTHLQPTLPICVSLSAGVLPPITRSDLWMRALCMPFGCRPRKYAPIKPVIAAP